MVRDFFYDVTFFCDLLIDELIFACNVDRCRGGWSRSGKKMIKMS